MEQLARLSNWWNEGQERRDKHEAWISEQLNREPVSSLLATDVPWKEWVFTDDPSHFLHTFGRWSLVSQLPWYYTSSQEYLERNLKSEVRIRSQLDCSYWEICVCVGGGPRGSLDKKFWWKSFGQKLLLSAVRRLKIKVWYRICAVFGRKM